MLKICIDTTVFKNFDTEKELLKEFLKEINSENYAYEGEKNYIDDEFSEIIKKFVSEVDIDLDIFLEIKSKYPNLHDGEVCLIAYSIQYNCCFISDDKKARKKAENERIHPCCIQNYFIGGSIGIILACRDLLNLITNEKAEDIYISMKSKNRLPNKNLSEFSLKNCN
ncbi:MAG: hypothetical protein DSY59_00375 [Persephonella sp.]|nr:MAG: hypothetical protein DSY60_01765 [Persephonella sp.]RUM62345.1 MAG: hypothetical protein DSY59_00375 [Persephonella sp.]